MKLSEKQRAKYFIWNGKSITGKNGDLPMKFIQDREAYILNNNKALCEHLKEEYSIAIIQGSKIISTTRDTSILPKKEDMLKNGFKYILCRWDGLNYEKIISNPIVIGTPKYQVINGQDFYNGTLHPNVRGEIMDSIKGSFVPHIRKIPYIGFYPLKIEMQIHDTLVNYLGKGTQDSDRWDVDNRAYPYAKGFCDVLTSLHKIKDDDRMYITQPPAAKFCPIDDTTQRKLVFIITQDTREEIVNHPYYKQFHSSIIGESGESEDNLLSKMDINPNDYGTKSIS